MVNVILGAIAVGAYCLLVLLITLIPPKGMTRLLAVLLLIPLPIALIVLPLCALGSPYKTQHVSGELFFDSVRWDAGALGSSGTTLILYEKPRYAPFLKHHLQRVVFDDTKCMAEQAFVELQPDRRYVLARCPWPEYLHKPGFHDFLVPLY